MYFSDDSDPYETSASQDERIEQELQHEKDEEKSMQALLESERKELFEEAFRERSHEIFHLPGLSFLKFTHQKIKFCFEPSKIILTITKDVKFYCSLKYYEEYGVWNIRRDSFPVNYKWRIYPIFYRGDSFCIADEEVAIAIGRIYRYLKMWAVEYEEFKLEKFRRYQNGEDVILDSEDEELFLDADQRVNLHNKRMRVLRRMIPPIDAKLQVLPPERPRKRKRRKVIVSDSD